ncbi:oxidoreductase [Cristinia sonorae]|uniref:Oxidoreductase n=1 Tax=Cristinia sonorae TaxID=1940300 RepID=A0A8K0XTJ1_9AGAR|nr:oxidoreductase [Cristinia sonorae]
MKKTALVTGCSEGGAGYAIALELQSQGIRVFAIARTLRTMTKLQDAGIEIFAMDVTVPSTIQSVKVEIEKLTGGTLDILINNAGVIYQAAAIEADIEAVKSLFAVNVYGVMEVTKVFSPLLIEASRYHISHNTGFSPRIINIGSLASFIPATFYSAYNASKAAVTMYGNTLRIEMEPFGVKVVTVHMGRVLTKIIRDDDWKGLPEGSLYSPIKATYEGPSHEVSPGKPDIPFTCAAKYLLTTITENGISCEAFAKVLVPQILQKNPPAFVWAAGQPWRTWFIDRFFSRTVWDSILKKGLQLDKVGAAFRKDIADRKSV